MKKKKTALLAIFIMIMMAALYGCSLNSDDDSASPQQSQEELEQQLKEIQDSLTAQEETQAKDSLNSTKEPETQKKAGNKDLDSYAGDNAEAASSEDDQKSAEDLHLEENGKTALKQEKAENPPITITLTPADDSGKNYTFEYNGKTYTAIHTKDNWKIIDSYDINDEDAMMVICQALIDTEPVHGKDMISFRTADDMVYEWEIHNMAYVMLPEDDALRKKAKDVDFDPEDQGRSFEEIYYDRTGKKFDLKAILGD